MARKRKKTKKTEKEETVEEKVETVVEEKEIIDEKEEEKEEENEKEVVKLNCVESLAYEGMKGIFVGAFMIGDLLGFYKKEESDD